MASLKALKDRRNSVRSTQKITKAMKMVAAAKLRRAQAAAEAGRPYAEKLAQVMASLASKVQVGPGASPLIAGTGSDKRHLLVVATSERGLAGAFNTNIVRAARKAADQLIAEGKDVRFYLIGKKGRAVISRLYPGKIVHQVDQSHIKNVGFIDALEVSRDLIARYEAGEYDVAHLFFARFRSALVQEPTQLQLIPVPLAPAVETQASGTSAVVEYEPDEETILAELLPRNIAIQLFRAMLENAASEQGSRMTAMDNATRNAGDLINRLSIQYNRSRQAAITTELIEIIAGAEAL
ncbi:F0F1 ATP synthase subunit gamma [Sphingomonas jatrophae]|uniref:ATP synthase gamma chain n=1 Tax=Sphingomonas jatrophae TaxID=1166337 RepID=A0A1I6K3V5_9SPHN|nr:F0F1 ATP synthase subunit gamma [Sphingomonas jatrophae]SFR85943.1 ATP synthase F1 subcomplex gamma subunit [Sphingomonas jatrophae]